MGDYMNATFLQRFLAYIIDILIVVILLNLITYNINFDKRNDLNSEITNYLTEYDPTNVESVNKLLDLQYQYNKESILVDAVSVIMTVGYFIVFQYFNKGQTIGKKLLKIRISGKDNKKVGIGQLVLRSIIIYQILVNITNLILISTVDKMLYLNIYGILTAVQSIFIVITMLFILYRKDKRGLHDIMSGTYVVVERG